MTQATVWHLIVSIFSAIGVTWLKARELVKQYPGIFLILLIVLAALVLAW